METYTLLRAFADSWFLVAMFAFFIGTCLYAFWPSLTSDRDAAAAIPLRDDRAKCAGTCDACASKFDFLKDAQNG